MISVRIIGADKCKRDLLKTNIINYLRSCGYVSGVKVDVNDEDILCKMSYDRGYKAGLVDAQVLPSTNHRSAM